MDAEKLISLGKELGLTAEALQQWMDEERSRERERRSQEPEAAKEDHARELERQAGERQLSELRLRAQELQQPSQAVTANSSVLETNNQDFRSPHMLIPAFNEARDELDAYIQRLSPNPCASAWQRFRRLFNGGRICSFRRWFLDLGEDPGLVDAPGASPSPGPSSRDPGLIQIRCQGLHGFQVRQHPDLSPPPHRCGRQQTLVWADLARTSPVPIPGHYGTP
ncbi:hypothetical protein HPB49_020243 [Dermacentor silvarum]|uniref:Uncharacterized protein n=1 Tax=Dermacentor silvarum TaxID=543639 RepID=A0ACB8CAZ6_DERSI|nr:hypothetical protein HPB49_020243 [Dermacentor silvarum]